MLPILVSVYGAMYELPRPQEFSSFVRCLTDRIDRIGEIRLWLGLVAAEDLRCRVMKGDELQSISFP
jgi:hypothetical protein